jgi:tetratricopeptide (TPR) repeat protein
MTAVAEPRTARAPRRHLRPVAILAAALTIVAGSYAVSAVVHTGASHPVTPETPGLAARPRVDPAAGPITTGPGTVAAIDQDIARWTKNLARNGKDFVSATYLGVLYEARGRLTGDLSDYQRAQASLETALGVVPDHMPARVLHARLLQTLHDFSGALAEARAVLREDPSQLQALATAGDAELELGDVSGAAAAFDRLEKEAPGAAVTARLSRLAFIRGSTTDAVTLARRAYDEASSGGAVGSSLGWYAYVVGTVELATGAPAEALTWLDRAASEWPGSYLTLAGQARAEAALGQTDAAIASYTKAIAIAPQPDSLTALGDLYALRGDVGLAADQYATVEAIGRLAAVNAQVYNRQLVLFAVNHDRDLADALRLAEQELAVRKDVYGYDADAWALLANGRAADADAAMRTALAFGTKDALLSYHAGMIAAALGDTARAKTWLNEALGLEGALDPLAASRATAALAALR